MHCPFQTQNWIGMATLRTKYRAVPRMGPHVPFTPALVSRFRLKLYPIKLYKKVNVSCCIINLEYCIFSHKTVETWSVLPPVDDSTMFVCYTVLFCSMAYNKNNSICLAWHYLQSWPSSSSHWWHPFGRLSQYQVARAEAVFRGCQETRNIGPPLHLGESAARTMKRRNH